MFQQLTLQELNKLWKTLESSFFHQADYYGDSGDNYLTRMELIDVMFDVTDELDSRS